MKQVVVVLLLAFSFSWCIAQENPVEYLEIIGQDQNKILNETWVYLNSLARSGSAVNAEEKKYNLAKSISQTLARVKQIAGFKGDESYRDSMVSYLQFSLDVIQGNTKHLIDLEKISQQSYDKMEAYILYKRNINVQFQVKSNMIGQAQKTFAKQHGVQLVEQRSVLVEKIAKASQVFNYKDLMYLSFFRCSVYEQLLLETLQNNNPTYDYQLLGLELSKLADESRSKMDTIPDLNADKRLRNITKEALRFFEDEAQELIPLHRNKQQLTNQLAPLKASLEEEQTKEAVEQYNALVKQINQNAKKLNLAYQRLNQERERIYSQWNNTAKQFVEHYVPK